MKESNKERKKTEKRIERKKKERRIEWEKERMATGWKKFIINYICVNWQFLIIFLKHLHRWLLQINITVMI